MLCREIIAVCSQIHTKHTNTLCGQNVEFVNVKLVVHIVTTGFKWLMSILGSVSLGAMLKGELCSGCACLKLVLHGETEEYHE